MASNEEFINIGTVTVAGIFYPRGTSLAVVLNGHFPPNIIFSAETTADSTQNIEVFRLGEIWMH